MPKLKATHVIVISVAAILLLILIYPLLQILFFSRSYAVQWKNDTGVDLNDVSCIIGTQNVGKGVLVQNGDAVYGDFPFPVPSSATVSWTTPDQKAHSAKVIIPPISPNSLEHDEVCVIVFTIHSDQTVKVGISKL
jgi:hypothetical protein